MPAAYTHKRFGEAVRGALPRDAFFEPYAQEAAFYLGLHGPDPLFYYHPLRENAVSAVGYRLHEARAADFFVAARDIWRKRGRLAADTAFLYGFICHFALDSACHAEVAAQMRATGLSHTEVESGFDPLILFRRMIAHSSEDVGMADSSVLQFIVSAMNAYEKIGMPEGELTLAHAIIYICTAPKSNRVYLAKEAAKKAIETIGDDYVPLHLRNTDFSTSDKSDKPYLYPHDFGGYVTQQDLPDGVAGKKFYRPGDNGKEKQIKEFMAYVKQRESEASEKGVDNKK